MDVQTIPFEQTSIVQREEAARILLEALAHVPSAWHDIGAARQEVSSFLTDPDRMAIAAIESDRLRAWIGCHSPFRPRLGAASAGGRSRPPGAGLRHGVGQRAGAKRAGVKIGAIWLGADDDFGGTSLYGADLYPDVLGHLRRINLRGKHPYMFYQRVGFAVVGVLPDVNGRGRHDILMAKRIER